MLLETFGVCYWLQFDVKQCEPDFLLVSDGIFQLELKQPGWMCAV